MEKETALATCLEKISSADNVLRLRGDIIDGLGAIGFDRAFFLSPLTMDRSFGRVVTNIGFPLAWEAYYTDKGHAVDPIPDIALKSRVAFRVSDLPDVLKLKSAEQAYLNRLTEWAMENAVAAIGFGIGGRFGFMMTAPESREATPDDSDLFVVQTIVQMSYARYCELLDAEHEEHQPLASRELEVLQLIATGNSNKAIADTLGISPATVDTHIRRIFFKLDVTDRTSATLKAVSRGLISATADVPQSVLDRHQRPRSA